MLTAALIVSGAVTVSALVALWVYVAFHGELDELEQERSGWEG